MAKSENAQAIENGFTEGIKEVMNWQVKAGLFYFDQAIKIGQTMAEFYQTRTEDSVKLAQTLAKTGGECVSEYRRTLATVAEKTAI